METLKQSLVEEFNHWHDIALDEDVEAEERNHAHKKVMEITDRLIQIGKMDAADLEAQDKMTLETEKMNLEERKLNLDEQKLNLESTKFEQSKEDSKKSDALKWVEIAVVPVGVLVIDYIFKRAYMTRVCNFEKDYTFTTTPGRSISALFKFKK